METSGRSYRVLWITLTFAALGEFLAGWLAPKAIAWYFNPPAQMGFNCVEPIKWALSKMQVAQLTGLIVGGVLGIVLALTAFRRKAPVAPPPGATAQ